MCMKHGAFSDLVPNRSESTLISVQNFQQLNMNLDNLEINFKKTSRGAQMLFLCFVFCPCANVTYAPLLLYVSPLLPAVPHVKIVKYVFNCRSGKKLDRVANSDYRVDVNCYTMSRCPVSYSDVYILNVSHFFLSSSLALPTHISK